MVGRGDMFVGQVIETLYGHLFHRLSRFYLRQVNVHHIMNCTFDKLSLHFVVHTRLYTLAS